MITADYLNSLPHCCGILLDSFDKIKQFSRLSDTLKGELYLKSGEKIITGHSLMGLFSLDLCSPVILYSSEKIEHGLEGLLVSHNSQMAV